MAVVGTAFFAPHQQSGVFEDTKMLRDCRQGNRERFGELAYICFAEGEPAQNRPPGRVGEGGECAIEGRIVNHKVNYLLFHLRRQAQIAAPKRFFWQPLASLAAPGQEQRRSGQEQQ